MPNPFDWRGPEFLVFYVILGVIVIAAVAVLRRRSEPLGAMMAPLTDYLKIAYLRGGPDEALRIATISLLDRGLVEVVDEHHLKTSSRTMPAGLQRTEERVLETCKDSTRASAIVDDTSLKITVTTECEGHLIRAGLLPDDKVKADRQWLLMAGMALLALVALVKIVIALGRGRPNIGFLIVALPVFGYVLYRIANPVRTLAGEAMLADLRQLFTALKDRTLSIGTPSEAQELALVAAVFGISALPGRGAVSEKLFRRPQSASSSSCGSSGSSSSCGSGGSSCGSSCGGGCGGGCGGCGS
jgi:uncharacterized protein (TIGR04222 family)